MAQALPLRARDTGRGPAVVLVHGFPLEGSMWNAAADLLAGSCRVVVPDQQGFGASALAGPTTMATYADDLAALLDALEIDRPALLAGLSFGGYVVMEFMRRHPHRLDAVGLIDTRETPDPPDAAANRRAQADRLVAGEPVSIVAEPMLPKMASPDAPESFREHWRRVMCAQSPLGVAAALRAIADRPDSAASLRAFRGRALLVVGEHDAITPVADHERMASFLREPGLHVIPRAGHMAPTEQPEAFAEIVRGFLGV